MMSNLKYTTAGVSRNPLDRLLSLLEGVRQTGPNRWIALCSHHADRNPSLSICDWGDRIGIHDFGGCATADILADLGLTMADLFEKPISHHCPPTRHRMPAADALAAIDHEAMVVAVLASDMRKAVGLPAEIRDRLDLAVQRIGAARDRCAPAALPRPKEGSAARAAA